MGGDQGMSTSVNDAIQASIIIPLFNRADLTRNCWSSIIERTGDIRYEVIFVDNASTDETPLFLEAIKGNENPPVTVLTNEKNEGFARACNQGVEAARSEVVVLLNNDTVVHENWLAPLLEELATHPETGVVGSRLLYPDGTIQHAGVCIDRKHIPFHPFVGAAFDDPRVCERRTFRIVTGACMALRKAEFTDLGGFDEGYINGHEDVDLCLRYDQSGKHSVYRPDSVVTHFESQSDGRMDHCQPNTHRTLRRWHNRLMQDDFNYDFIESERQHAQSPLSIAIKTPTINKRAELSSTGVKAEAIARNLSRMGHNVEIHANPDWGLDDRKQDVTIVLPGMQPYLPKPYSRTVLWLSNHRQLRAVDEQDLSRYQLVICPPDLVDSLPDRTQVLTLPSLDKELSREDLDTLEAALLKQATQEPPVQAISEPSGKVSVLMPTYNRRNTLGEAIRSVIAQSYPNWELIVVNDGGEDVSDIIEAFNDERITYHANERGSKGKAVNTAFSLSTGEYIAYLDDDDVWYPHHLERAMFMLCNLPGVDMTYSDTVNTTKETCGETYKITSSLPVQSPQVTFADLLETNCIPGITVVHSRALFEAVGGMDEKLKVLIDFDMWRRLAMVTSPYHVSEATAEHFIRPAKTTTGEGQITNLHLASRRQYLANACRVLRKKMPTTLSPKLQSLQRDIRKKVQALFLQAQGDYFSEKGEYRRAAKSYKLAGTLTLNLSRKLINRSLSQTNTLEEQ